MEDLSVLRSEDLTRRLHMITEELEELEEERSFVLKQTGLHLSGHTVKRYDAEVQTLKESIAELMAEFEIRK